MTINLYNNEDEKSKELDSIRSIEFMKYIFLMNKNIYMSILKYRIKQYFNNLNIYVEIDFFIDNNNIAKLILYFKNKNRRINRSYFFKEDKLIPCIIKMTCSIERITYKKYYHIIKSRFDIIIDDILKSDHFVFFISDEIIKYLKFSSNETLDTIKKEENQSLFFSSKNIMAEYFSSLILGQFDFGKKYKFGNSCILPDKIEIDLISKNLDILRICLPIKIEIINCGGLLFNEYQLLNAGIELNIIVQGKTNSKIENKKLDNFCKKFDIDRFLKLIKEKLNLLNFSHTYQLKI